MDAADVLVLILSAGAVGLLVWGEISCRRNEARRKQAAIAAQPGVARVEKQEPGQAESEIATTKAA